MIFLHLGAGLVAHGKADQVGVVEFSSSPSSGKAARSTKSSVPVSASAALRSVTLLKRTTTTSPAGLILAISKARPSFA